MIAQYRKAVEDWAKLGIPPLPLSLQMNDPSNPSADRRPAARRQVLRKEPDMARPFHPNGPHTIRAAGDLATFAQVGCRVEIPGCSLCMDNQARVQPGATVISNSTRNFDNRLGDGTKVFLASTELTAMNGLLGGC
jgi:aconitase B